MNKGKSIINSRGRRKEEKKKKRKTREVGRY